MHVQYETHTDVQQRACHNYVASMAKPVGWMWGYTHVFHSGKRRWTQSIYVSFHLILPLSVVANIFSHCPISIHCFWVCLRRATTTFCWRAKERGQYRWRWGGEGKRKQEIWRQTMNKVRERWWLKRPFIQKLKCTHPQAIQEIWRNFVLHEEPSSPINILWSEKRHICTKQTHH